MNRRKNTKHKEGRDRRTYVKDTQNTHRVTFTERQWTTLDSHSLIKFNGTELPLKRKRGCVD